MGKTNKRYITKRLVVKKSNGEFKRAASKAIQDNGYVIVAKDGWIVKEYLDGNIERIRRIDTNDVNQEIILD